MSRFDGESWQTNPNIPKKETMTLLALAVVAGDGLRLSASIFAGAPPAFDNRLSVSLRVANGKQPEPLNGNSTHGSELRAEAGFSHRMACPALSTLGCQFANSWISYPKGGCIGRFRQPRPARSFLASNLNLGTAPPWLLP